MEKNLGKFQIATIKRMAQNVNSLVSKKKKLAEQIENLQKEYDEIVKIQDQYEAPIKEMTGGYTTEDLINKIVETSIGKDGKEIKIVKYVLKYPETIIPVEETKEKVEQLPDVPNEVIINEGPSI